MERSYRLQDNKDILYQGIKDGIPIGLGYLAVSFSLGIAAKNAGLSTFQAFLCSLLCNASAGEYAGFTVIAASATYLECALVTLVTNARYMLMSCALSQRVDPDMPFKHRLIMAFYIVDEVFGIMISRPGFLNPYYMYGAILMAAPSWAIGTVLGAIAGSVLPPQLVSAFSVALYGMFVAVFIPPAKKDKVIAALVVISFFLSYCASYLPVISSWSEGTRTIILTVALSALAARFFPRKNEVNEHE